MEKKEEQLERDNTIVGKLSLSDTNISKCWKGDLKFSVTW